MREARRKDRREPLPEYDFSRGVRGRYAARFSRGTNLVLLARDVAKAFPTSRAVNQALRRLIRQEARKRKTE